MLTGFLHLIQTHAVQDAFIAKMQAYSSYLICPYNLLSMPVQLLMPGQ